MKVKVRAFGDLTAYLGNESIIELEDNAELKNLISKLMERIGNRKKDFLRHYEVSSSDLAILLNGRNIKTMKKLDTPLKDRDVVTLLPLVPGG